MPSDNPVRHYLNEIGLQVYTLRNEIGTDLPGTLRAIKAAGYAQIELMRTLNARDFVPLAKDLGLGVTSAFIDSEIVTRPSPAGADALAAHLALASELRLRYLVFGYIGKGDRETVAQMKAHAARANAFGRQCRDAGIQLCYHHHAFEFAPLDDGQTTGWEILVSELDPRFVQFELDVFWLALGGLDPVQTLRKLSGRVAQVHLKDLKPYTPRLWDEHVVPADAFQELGRGSLHLKAILQVCAETNVAQCHVEQDQSPHPLASIATSLQHLRALAE
ncbi:MAG: Inosose dehydratase [Verrucomicrobiota bacterium]|jgi:sugar phosphate isomerase/epimerase